MRKVVVLGSLLFLLAFGRVAAWGQTGTIPPPPTVTSTSVGPTTTSPSVSPTTTEPDDPDGEETERPRVRDDDDGDGDGGIPVTGSDVAGLAVIGLLLVGAGVALRLRANRRMT